MTVAPASVLGQASTIPDSAGGSYVVAAYIVFLVLIAVYVAIMATRLTKIAKSADELEARLDQLEGHAEPDATPLEAQPLTTTTLSAPADPRGEQVAQ